MCVQITEVGNNIVMGVYKEIWHDMQSRHKVMNQIENVECFKNCTKLCKPHESNKMVWEVYEKNKNLNKEEWEKYKDDLFDASSEIKSKIKHSEFI